MSDALDQLKVTLRQRNVSVTAARLEVFKALQDQEPQTMHEVVAACQDSIDRASVYRTIALFEKLGIVERLQIGWKYKLELSDAFHHHHHHFSCRQCGRVIALPEDPALEGRLHQLAQDLGLQAKGHQVEVSGLCQNCQ